MAVQRWLKTDPVIEGGRIVRGGMWPHQREWWDLDNFIRAMVGGYGSGKTLIGSKWAIGMAIHNAPAPFAVVSPTFPVARETTISTLVELCDAKQRLLRARFSYAHNKTDHVFRIRYRNKRAKIIVYSGEHPDRLKGPNLCGALIDEPFIQDRAVFDQIMARVRHPRAKLRAIGLTGTPEQLNWGYDLIEGELADSHDVGFVRAPTRANKALPPDYEKRLREKYDDKTAEAYLDGHFVNLAEGLVYHAFSADSVVEAHDEIPEGAWLVCGMDFNVNPMAFCVGWTDGRRTHILREYEQPNSDTEFACQTLRRDWPTLNEIFPDVSCRQRQANAPGGVTSLAIIKSHGFIPTLPRENPRRFERYETVNGALRHGRVTISPTCKKLIRYFRAYSHERINKDDHKAMSHGLDAAGYLVCGLHPIDRPTFRIGTY